MEWAQPQYSRRRVNEAGRRLVTDSILQAEDDYLLVINNWRSSHSFPLNTFQNGLRKRGVKIFQNCIVSQRIKRLSSIDAKLRRFENMTLSQMQDIGGCRAVLRSVNQVRKLEKSYLESDLKHALQKVNDYIENPRNSGYRGLHLIYTYRSDRKATYNELKIEMQLRSQTQHIWATAVETVGTFVQQALKSSQGEEEWLRFFALMGSALAIREKTPLVPGTPDSLAELQKEIEHYSNKLDVKNRLEHYRMALKVIDDESFEGSHFFVLKLNPPKQEVTVAGFPKKDSKLASYYYQGAENDLASVPGGEAVMVSVDSASSLRRAYPNYFLDTRKFLELLAFVTGPGFGRPKTIKLRLGAIEETG